MKNYYYILGIHSAATESEIKKAYRKLSLKFHPDKNDGDKFFEDRFKEINEAYENLIIPEKRKVYDEILNEQENQEEQTRQEQRDQVQKNQEEHRRHGQSEHEQKRLIAKFVRPFFFIALVSVVCCIFIFYFFQSRKSRSTSKLNESNYNVDARKNYQVDNSRQLNTSAKDKKQIGLHSVNSVDSTSSDFFLDEHDNERYKIRRFGHQIWMIENFRFISPKSKTYNGTKEMGRLYMWQEAVSNAPNGWRLPSNKDFHKLLLFLGGRKIKTETFELTSTKDFNILVGRESSDAAFYSTQSIDDVTNFDPIADFWCSTTTFFDKKVKYHYIFRPSKNNVYLTGDITLQYFSVRYIKE
jgi:uncharacterized protein (TIGR02145 family)